MGTTSDENIGRGYPVDQRYRGILLALRSFEGSWFALFDDHIAARGLVYARSGLVISHEMWMSSPRSLSVSGRVKGTRSYDVACQMNLKGTKIELSVSCSCPYSAWCKHAAALLTTFFSAAWDRKLIAYIDADVGAPAVVQAQPVSLQDSGFSAREDDAPLSKETERKLERMLTQEPSLPPHAMMARFRIGYLLRLEEKPSMAPFAHWRVDAGLVESASNGLRVTAPRDADLSAFCAAGGVEFVPEDGKLLLGLNVLSAVRRSFYGHGPSAAYNTRGDLLLAAVESGRCFLETSSHVLKRGLEFMAHLGWVSTVKGERCPAILNLPEKVVLLSSQYTPLYLDRASGIVGTVSVGDSALDVWQWLNLPKIKPPQANALLRSLKSKTLPTLGLEDVAGAGTQLEPHTPQVVVSVFPVQAKGEDRSGGWSLGDVNSAQVFNFSSGEMPLHLVKPSFIYGDREVTLASTERLFPDPDNQGASLLRNDIFEKEVEKQLIELGLIPNRNPRRSQDRRGDGLFRVSPDHFNYQAIFLQTVAQLVKYAQARGWKIDIPASVLPVVVKDEDLGVTLCGEEGSPWFEAALDIKAGDATIDLGEVILTFLYKNRYSLESIHLSQAEKVVVMLDHHCIEFERERLLRLLKVVRELSDPEHTKALRFNRYSGYAFEGALRDSFGRWESGSEIAALRERVAQIERRPAVGEPPLFEGNLRDYQQQGLAWLSVLSEAELGGVLADDMGLGKTVQIIALILRERSRGMRGPHLVVCPKSVVPNWSAELARFAPSLKVYSSIGAGRSKSVELLEEADVVITTYPLLLKDVELLRKVRFDVAVFDEAQHIKNPQTGAYRAAEGLTARLKIPVSGTPLENNLQDLWAHFNLSMPGFLYSRDVFTKTYRKPIEREGNAELREHLAARIKPFVLRRTKAEVAKELPPLTEIIVRCSLDGAQRDLYEAIRQLTTKRVREALRSKGASRSHIEFLDALLKLRQVCCDARLVKTTAAKGVKKSAKLESLLELLETLLAEGRAIVVFSQFTSMLELIEQEVQAREIPYCLLTGQSNDRELSVKNFQAGEKKLFLMSLKAGGVGINLTAADAVVIYDPWWNPAVESQAICRAHRIGQTSPVFAYRLIAEGTIEEKILDLQARKRALVENLLAENESPPELSEELVEYLFAPME